MLDVEGDSMQEGDISFAGFVMTAQEWQALDAPSRALLLAIATASDDRGVVAAGPPPRLAIGSGSIRRPPQE